LCGKENILISIDDITDASRRKVTNGVIGTLKNDKPLSEKSFLLPCQEISAVNHTKIARVVKEALQTLWSCGVKSGLLVTDAAPDTKTAADRLSVSYPELKRVTCVAHALYRVCETIRVL
jgi:hypothetical protein